MHRYFETHITERIVIHAAVFYLVSITSHVVTYHKQERIFTDFSPIAFEFSIFAGFPGVWPSVY